MKLYNNLSLTLHSSLKFPFSTMILPSNFLCFFTLILSITRIFTLQQYESSYCTSQQQLPGSNYTCNSKNSTCDTFIVYRAQPDYQTLNSISSLFNTSISRLLLYNNMSQTDQNNLNPGHEIIVPVKCSCSNLFWQNVLFYNASKSDSESRISCEVFEGLVNPQSLIEANQKFGDFSMIELPVKCACPDSNDKGNGTKYLVTYPVIRTDRVDLIASKFSVSEKIILDANNLDHLSTIFPKMTLLIPTHDVRLLDLSVISSPHDPFPVPETNVSMLGKRLNVVKIVLVGSIIFLSILLLFGIFILIGKNVRLGFKMSSTITPHLLPLSPDLVDGMLKLKSTLVTFSFEEIANATNGFREECVLGSKFYKGSICNIDVVIEELSSKDAAHNVVSILRNVNHFKLVKLEGFCSDPKPYLVYEFAENGSLRDCLSSLKQTTLLTWTKRVQIATDIAVGLHYLHCCTRPNYVHCNINSKSILLTGHLRAKISGFRWAKSVSTIQEMEEDLMGKKGYMAPEYLNSGHVSTKMDIYALGVVLLELISGKKAVTNGVLLKDSLDFSDLQDSLRCLEILEGFMDPVLEKDYCVNGAMYLALLAMACVQEDLLLRPSINDVLKAISSIP